MTTNELIEQTKRHSGFRSSTTIDAAFYLSAVNQGYLELATFQGEVRSPGRDKQMRRKIRFLELEDKATFTISASPSTNFVSYVSNTENYNLFTLLSVYNTTDTTPVGRTSRAAMAARNPADTGNVRLWVPGGLNGLQGFYYWAKPTVSTTLTARVYKYPETLVAGGPGPVIPAEWHEAIALFAGSTICTLLKMYEDSAQILQRAHMFIANRKSPHEDSETFGRGRYIHIGGR